MTVIQGKAKGTCENEGCDAEATEVCELHSLGPTTACNQDVFFCLAHAEQWAKQGFAQYRGPMTPADFHA